MVYRIVRGSESEAMSQACCLLVGRLDRWCETIHLAGSNGVRGRAYPKEISTRCDSQKHALKALEVEILAAELLTEPRRNPVGASARSIHGMRV